MAQLLGIKKIPLKVPIDEIEYVNIRLTGDEASTLYDVLCKVGGNQNNSRRKYIAEVFETLHAVFPDRDCQPGADLDGRMHFMEQL
ncbi:hypothetical protein LCGC14_2003350 [marine sediment metagenome]|uniref:Uncharacterized protein n=1 Tax=marine sediment metagenome TaxID=412755 RepID=A0A0F9F2K2_9ZZZZ